MTYSNELIEELTAAAQAAADAARPETLRHFRTDPYTDNKDGAGFDPVTEGDRAAERAMREVLSNLRPDDAILGEEFGAQPGTSGLTWVLDPIDGTRAYIAGAPTWGVLVAVSDQNGPILGLIDQPHTRERFFGGPHGATLDAPGGRRRLATRAPRPLSQALVMTTFPEVGTAEDGAAFRRVSAAARLTRYGLDCYAYGLVALGLVDLVIEAGLQAHDIQGPMAVIQAAGGIVTDWQGGPAHQGGRVLAAANAAIHTEAMQLLKG
ncbi:inositol monophosphatase family protein [Palleronia sp.]|uniref:inositol monophosphatase family protein n=1 Tax=Palleronia sp. TaxID=1940284 RepID=UPI0035C85529